MEICELSDKEFRIILLKKFCDILLLDYPWDARMIQPMQINKCDITLKQWIIKII